MSYIKLADEYKRVVCLMQTIPKVTVVTVTFNLLKSGREKTFRQCVESVHNQAYSNIEHLIIDGASDDGTVELLKEYANKGWIKYISEPDSGIYNAMNKGINLANGKYISFLNSDDFYTSDVVVGKSVDLLEENAAVYSYGKLQILNVRKNKKKVSHSNIYKFLYKMPFAHPTLFCKKDYLLKTGLFDDTYKLSADYKFIVKMLLENPKGVKVDEIITTFRNDGATTEKSDISHLEAKKAIAENLEISNKLADKIHDRKYVPFLLLYKYISKYSFLDKCKFYWYNLFGYFRYLRKKLLVLNWRKGKRHIKILGINFIKD